MISGGYFTVGRFRRIPIRIHLATPVGFFVFTGFSFNPVAWAAFLFIILVHELGHAALVRRYRLSVVSIDINGIGGVCRWAGHATPIQESVVAWGGVLAQAVLLVLIEVVGKFAAFRGDTIFGQVAPTLVFANVYLIALNLLPIPPLDGAKAWALFRWRNLHFWGRRGVLKMRAAALEAELERMQQRKDPAPESEPSRPTMLN